MQADFDLDPDGSLRPRRANGGAREGAGRKPLGYQKPKEIVDFDQARARKEAALADKYELEYKIQSGEYVSRDSVKQASATVLSTIAQTLRSVPRFVCLSMRPFQKSWLTLQKTSPC